MARQTKTDLLRQISAARGLAMKHLVCVTPDEEAFLAERPGFVGVLQYGLCSLAMAPGEVGYLGDLRFIRAPMTMSQAAVWDGCCPHFIPPPLKDEKT